jgi:hypothetical protein
MFGHYSQTFVELASAASFLASSARQTRVWSIFDFRSEVIIELFFAK